MQEKVLVVKRKRAGDVVRVRQYRRVVYTASDGREYVFIDKERRYGAFAISYPRGKQRRYFVVPTWECVPTGFGGNLLNPNVEDFLSQKEDHDID